MRTIRTLIILVCFASVGLLVLSCGDDDGGQPTLVVLTHSSFDIDRELVARFEQEHHVTVDIRKGGDANEVVNRALLNAGNPEGDVLYGIDNLTLPRTVGKGLFEEYTSTLRDRIPSDVRAGLGDSREVTPIDYGYVALNFDRAKGTAPSRLEDLTNAAWRGKLVVEDPTTSSPGLQFLATTVAQFGETGSYTWKDYWRDLRANDVLVVDGWDAAYNTYFSRNGGDRPVVVSYTTSPAAEVFFSEGKLSEPPTSNVIPAGTKLFRQVEAAGVLRGTKQPELAGQFIDFLLSDDVQAHIPETMFVYPVMPGLATPDWWQWAKVDVQPAALSVDGPTIERWVREWTDIMRR
ncbi:MAG: thiamine ABC transporter substrate-binding protein [Dehalococcoidia bacterium]|nr:thiamine ABC transporter substrate-binding protein [Dehalococcoidia bacterium]HRC61940.1 thiamine ABC transporter substrate-binding protein [Dehalococcoidia bacterium]